MYHALLSVLTKAGMTTETLAGPDGARVLVLPHGGRVIGLFPSSKDANFLWVNPALDTPQTARPFFASDQWRNTGGDRTWLAPEIDFFMPRFPDTSVYVQPRTLDAGDYHTERTGEAVRLTQHLALRASRTGETVEVQIVKHVEPTANPLHKESMADAEGVAYAGYTLRSSLDILAGGTRQSVGLWHLLQLPHGGQLRIVTTSQSRPRVYFGDIPSGDLVVEERCVHYNMRAPGSQKIGVQASAATGRVGYLYGCGDKLTLVARNFRVNPSGTYVDAPADEPSALGYAVQACNIFLESLGSFSELEYHVPAIGGTCGGRHSEDISRVWAFRGNRRQISAIAGRLLCAPEDSVATKAHK